MYFVRNGKRYEGFQPFSKPNDLMQLPSNLVVVWCDDIEPIMWIVQNMSGLKALKAYCIENWGADRIRVQVFSAG